MATSGPNSPATIIDNSGGDFTWSNPGNAASSNNSYAVCDGLSDGPNPLLTNRLKATNFGFSIPSDAVINGVVVEIEIKAHILGNSSLSADCTDQDLKLVKAGTAAGINKTSNAAILTTDSYKSFGGPTDLWGLSLVAADINSSTFGCQYQASFNEDNDCTISVDHIRITVYYNNGSASNTSNFFMFLR